MVASLMLPLPVIPEISLAKAYCRFDPFCQGSKGSKTTSMIFSPCAWWHQVFSLTKHLGDQPNACWIRIPWRTPVKHLHEYTLVCWLCPQTANTCLSRKHIASISVLITRAQNKRIWHMYIYLLNRANHTKIFLQPEAGRPLTLNPQTDTSHLEPQL